MTIQNEHKIQYNIYNMYRKIKLGKNLTMTDASIMWFLYLKNVDQGPKTEDMSLQFVFIMVYDGHWIEY